MEQTFATHQIRIIIAHVQISRSVEQTNVQRLDREAGIGESTPPNSASS